MYWRCQYQRLVYRHTSSPVAVLLVLDRYRILVSIHTLCCHMFEYDISLCKFWTITNMPAICRAIMISNRAWHGPCLTVADKDRCYLLQIAPAERAACVLWSPIDCAHQTWQHHAPLSVVAPEVAASKCSSSSEAAYMMLSPSLFLGFCL